MKYLIFETDLLGHRLEYLHYYYVEAMNHLFNNYVFCIPEPFKVLRSKYEWATADNVTFIYISKQEENLDSHKKLLKYCCNIGLSQKITQCEIQSLCGHYSHIMSACV